jgi:isoamylase
MDQLLHKTNKKISAGKYYPLGATPTDTGVNFAVYSQNAAEVFLLLFEKDDGNPSDVIRIDNRTKNIFHVFVEGVKKGQLYGYKVKGEYNPNWGYRFNENRLLIDPYSKALSRKFSNEDNLLLGYNPSSIYKDQVKDTRDNSSVVPKSIVINDEFDWGNDIHPEIPFEKLIIYEVHVKGFTMHESSKVENRGTYLGFIEKIPYLKELGINAVELLPIQEFYIEDFLTNKGLTNFWGYNTIGFFSPESSYSTGKYPGCQVEEFKKMVMELHKAGIEVILDVVYNHTAEGNELGPTMCFKGIDNPSYYCLTGNRNEPARYYMNYTGCGNSVDLSSPPVIKFVMDSLRYWAETMHVDGFRFDLASVLGREGGLFQKSASFFDSISQDPVLSRIKLIAEPWDLGTYEVGNFPIDWAEWNGKFRDCIRKFGKGDDGLLDEFGFRMTGSSDLYGDDGRGAYNSINFISCHDGFTLNDLVSYNVKHNDQNLENNNDGSNDNNSWNCGIEGDTPDAEIQSLRTRQMKNFACYLMLAAGTPMILGGDEFARTQNGNNNAYCQDNDINWFDWNLVKKNSTYSGFYKKLIAFRKKYSVFQRKKFFTGKDLNNNDIMDITWYDKELKPLNWCNNDVKTVAYLIDGSEENSESGEYYLYLIFNADFYLQKAVLPAINKKWYRKIDTFLKPGDDFCDDSEEILLNPQDQYLVNPRSVVVLLGI